MALFSRGKRDRDQSSESPAEQPAPETVAADEPATAEPEPEASTEPEPVASPASSPEDTADAASSATVGISVSSFRGVGAAAPAAPRRMAREIAPTPTETMPGMRDNVLLAEALAALPAAPAPAQIIEVARQLLQGQLFLRVKGDARALLSEGRQLPLAIATLGEESFVVAYSSGVSLGASVRSDGDADTSAVSQSALTVIRYVLAGTFAGLVVDPASTPARAVLRRDMLAKMLEAFDPALTIKTLLAGERSAATAPALADALTRVPFWVAVSRVGETGKFGVAEARTAEGERYLELFSHPLEVVALGRGDQPAPMTGEQLGKALRSDEGLTGVVVDPAGPWIRLTRADLAGIIRG